jgi:hypothetical protein
LGSFLAQDRGAGGGCTLGFPRRGDMWSGQRVAIAVAAYSLAARARDGDAASVDGGLAGRTLERTDSFVEALQAVEQDAIRRGGGGREFCVPRILRESQPHLGRVPVLFAAVVAADPMQLRLNPRDERSLVRGRRLRRSRDY